MRKITERQKEVFNFIYQYTKSENRPPTIMEIKGNFGFASNQGVLDHLTALEKKGYIRRQKKSRGIVVLKTNGIFPILGHVAAGNPIDAEEFHEGNLKLEELFDSDNSYVIKVKGDSMKNAGIFDGDYVIVRYQKQVEHGEIAIAVIDSEATVKRVMYVGDKIVLQPENEAFAPITIDSDQESIICGKVIGVVRQI